MSNLRIVDSSVIPEVTNANLNAPVMMLAEKGNNLLAEIHHVFFSEIDFCILNLDICIAAEDIITFHQVLETTNIVSFPVSASTNSIVSTTPSKSASILAKTNKLVLVSIFTFIVKFWVLSPN